jgi:hypothetical protein
MAPSCQELEPPGIPARFTLVGQFGRVLEHQDGAIDRGKAGTGGLEMALKDLVFVNFRIGQEAIGCFGVGPILAGQRKAAAMAPASWVRSLRRRWSRRLSRKQQPASSRSTQAVASVPSPGWAAERCAFVMARLPCGLAQQTRDSLIRTQLTGMGEIMREVRENPAHEAPLIDDEVLDKESRWVPVRQALPRSPNRW